MNREFNGTAALAVGVGLGLLLLIGFGAFWGLAAGLLLSQMIAGQGPTVAAFALAALSAFAAGAIGFSFGRVGGHVQATVTRYNCDHDHGPDEDPGDGGGSGDGWMPEPDWRGDAHGRQE